MWSGALAAAFILVCGFGLWRLAQGPIELDWLTPVVRHLLDRSVNGMQIAISGARLRIDREDGQLDLTIEGVRIAGLDREPMANLPDLSASLSLRSLLRGRVAPTRLAVERPILRFIRDETGEIHIGWGDQHPDAPGLLSDLLEQLAGPPNPDTPFGEMRRVVIRDAALVLDDRQTGRHWQADHVDAEVERDLAGLAGDLSLALPLAKSRPELHARYQYASAERTLDIVLEVGAIEPAALAPLSPELAPLASADFPISGTLVTRFDLRDLATEGVRVDLHLGQGSIRNPLLPEGFLALRQGTVRAAYAPESGELRLLTLDLDLGDNSAVRFNGKLAGITPAMIAGADPLPPSISGTLGIALADLPVAKFETLWPPALAPGGRRWVLANVHAGMLDDAAVRLDLAVGPLARSAEVVSAHGTMRYHDATISYFRSLTPLRKVSGTATLDDRRLLFTPTSGSVKSVQITGGSVLITDLGAPVEWLTTDLAIAGPIQDILETIDAKPLRYAHDIGVDPARVAGRTEANLHFRLPLLKDIKLDQVQYSVKASLTGAAISDVAMNRNLTDGNFGLEIAPSGAHFHGDARFDRVPLDIDASLFFKLIGGARARYRISMLLDDEQRRRLGFDFFPDWIGGPVAVDLTYRMIDAARAEAEAALDLRSASLSVAEAGWKKPPGAPASARLALDLRDEQVTQLRDIEVNAAGLEGKFAVMLEPTTERIDRVDVKRLIIADDEVSGSVTRRREGGWHVDLRGKTLDLSHWMKDFGKVGRRQPSAADPPLQIDARLGRLLLGPQREVRDVAVRLLREGVDWRAAQIEAQFPNGRRLSLHSANEAGRRGLTFRSDDLGSTLNLLDVTDNVVGGQVTVTGQITGETGKEVVAGHIEGEDYSLVRAPVLARILSLPSFTGVGSMLAGKGIPFSTLRGDFSYSDNHLVFDKLLAYGEAIGVTTNGVADLGRDRLDLQGTIVPAYALNSIVGNVPVIGSLLLGGEGEGLFAANFRVKGSPADPRVSVNPLSALAPGFLRRLFQPNFGVPPPVQQSLDVQ